MDLCPKLRSVDIIPVQVQGRPFLLLRDPLGLTPKAFLFPAPLAPLLTLLDGRHTVREIQVALMRMTGTFIFSDEIEGLLKGLDEHLLLDNDRFREALKKAQEAYRESEFREPVLAGSVYPKDPDELRAMLDRFFAPSKGPGKPRGVRGKSPLKAIVVPHIDFSRGGHVYAWGYKALAECPPASLFVILGIAHYPTRNLFTVTTKNFPTPLGVSVTDKRFIATLQKRCDFDLLADELVHKGEHSIELQVVWLQHLFGSVPIVPILCASFEDKVSPGGSPMELEEIRQFVKALRETAGEWDEPVTFIASVDLSHIGRRFGDLHPLTPEVFRWLEAEDRYFLRQIAEGDAEAMFASIHRDGNSRRVDAYPAVYVLLKTFERIKGEVKAYDQSVERETGSIVSFGAVVFP